MIAISPLLRLPLSLKAKLLLCETYIRAVIIAGYPVWGFISKRNIQRLQVVQNRALGLIGRYDWYTRNNQMLSNTPIPRLKAYIEIIVSKLHASTKLSRNPYIRQLEAYC